MLSDEDLYHAFLHQLIGGDYAQAYSYGWDACLASLGRDKHNPYSHRAYPLEYKAYNHGFEDGIALLTEWERHWRGKKNL